MPWLQILLLLADWAVQAVGGGLASTACPVVFARGEVAAVETWQLVGDLGIKGIGPSGEKLGIPAADLLCLDAGAVVSANDVPRVLLRNGELINASLAAGSTGQRLVFESALWGKLEWAAKDVAIYQVAPELPGGDRPARPFILLKNGDVVAAAVEQVGAQHVAVDTEFGQTQIPLETVSAVVLSADAPPFDGRGPTQLLVELADGQRLYCDGIDQDADRVILTREARQCRLEAGAVRRIVWPAATISYLSEMPVRSEGRGYFGQAVEPRRDRNALGGPLRIGNNWFPRGLGMRPRSRSVFQLNGSWAYLTGSVGPDARLGRRCNCQVSISADGRGVLTDSIQGGQGPRRLLVRVSGIREIELAADFGPHGDLGDYVNWCDLLLVGERKGGGR